MPRLVFQRRARELMTVRVRNGLVVGRDPSCDANVPDPAVSRRQFELVQEGEQWFLVDLSGRGTDVLGKLERRVLLEDGMDVGLGGFRAVFNISDGGGGADADTEVGGHEATKTLRQPKEKGSQARSEPSYVVTVQEPKGKPRRVVLNAPLTVGTGADAALRLEDPHVSALHCRLEPTATGIRVRDAESKNGILAGEFRLFDAVVPAGTTIQIGETEIRTEAPAEQLPEEFEALLSHDPAMQKIFQRIERVARWNAPVLIMGESGTGKELVARAIHARSLRAKGPFEAVNCSAFTDTLAESELFGHVKGAFTGAEKDFKGPFERANGGTIFLDELGELPPAQQAKLLRVLETGQVQRVGDEKTRASDFRVVAATNVNLLQAAQDDEFREDLYYRLAVGHVVLPPLRARRGDLKMLVDHFLALYEPGTRVTMSKAAMERLQQHDWPGNVRELKNVVQRALMERAGNVIQAEELRFDAEELGMGNTATRAEDAVEWRGRSMFDITRDILQRALVESGGNRRAAMRATGVTRSYFDARVPTGKANASGISADE